MLNGNLPSPGEFTFSMNLSPLAWIMHKDVIRKFIDNEAEVYKLTFRLFPLFQFARVTKDPALFGLFCTSLLDNEIIAGEQQAINMLARHAFEEYWGMALQPSYWPPDHLFEMAHLRAHGDVVDQWQQNKKQQIDDYEDRLVEFRKKLEA